MGKTKIEWATDTWNPVTGCTKVSEGCRHCYAERMVKRLGHRVHAREAFENGDGTWRPGEDLPFSRVAWHHDRLEQPLHWRKPRRVFVCSMSDLFHPDVPDVFIRAVFTTMAAARKHTFMVLTKRPERMLALKRHWEEIGLTIREGFGAVLPNVIGMVSVEDQDAANSRVPLLLLTPFAVRGVSYEPALGPVDLRRIKIPRRDFPAGAIRPIQQTVEVDALAGRRITDMGIEYAGGPRLDWVICGGESGPKARPMHPDWARSMRDQCQAAVVPFFFKQWGEWQVASRANGHIGGNMPDEGSRYTWLGIDGRTQNPSSHGLGDDAYAMARVGKKRAGRELDGQIHDEIPEMNK